MTAKITPTLQQAIDALSIRDVYLGSNRANVQRDFLVKYQNISAAEVQQLQTPLYSKKYEVSSEGQHLNIAWLLGLRWVERNESEEEPTVIAQIEAEFIAEYTIEGELGKDNIDEFAKKNAIYHIWPYWREFLCSQAERLRLPRPTVSTLQLSHHRERAK